MISRRSLLAGLGFFAGGSAAIALPESYGISKGWPMGAGQFSPALSIVGTPPAGTLNVPYSWTPTVFGGAGTKTFQRLGPALQTGLSFSTTTGTISGTPTSSGTVSGIGVTVTDNSGTATLSGLSINVSSAVVNNDILLILGGQSNQGAQGTAGATPPAAHFALASNPNVRIFNQDLSATPGVWQSYQVLQNSQPLMASPGSEYWGAEATFLEYYTTKYPDARIDIVKHPPGGSQLYDDTTAASWNPAPVVATTRHWPILVQHVGFARAAGLNVRAGYKTIFDWRQGENDSVTLAKANAYQANLALLFSHAVSELGADLIFVHQLFGTSTPNTGNLATVSYPNCDIVRAAQAAAVSAFGPTARLIDDSSAWIGCNGSVHYDPAHIDGTSGTGASLYAVFALPDVTVAGSIAGTLTVGQALTYTPATWNYQSAPFAVAYQWKSNGVAISGATGLTYTLQGTDQGNTITVTETATALLGPTATTCVGVGPIAAAPSQDAATTALINAAVAAGGTAPSAGRQASIDTLIAGLKADGVWTKLVALEIFAAHDVTFASMEWKGATKKAAVFAGSPTFVTDLGWALDGATQSLTSGLNPTTLGVAQDTVGWGLWIAAGTSANHAAGISASAANRFTINKTGGGSVSGACSSAAGTIKSSAGAPPRIADHYMQRNGSSTTIDYYADGASSALAVALSSTAVQNAVLLLGQNGVTPTWANDRYFAHYFTNGTLSSTDIANLHSRLAAYKSALGA